MESKKKFRCQVMTFDQVVFDGEVIYLNAPGEEGYLGVLANHAPIISLLGHGEVLLRKEDGQEEHYQIQTGLMQFQKNHARFFITFA